MIAKQKIHKANNFMGAFGYNDQKVNHEDPTQRAEILNHNFTLYDYESISKEINLLQKLRPNLTRDAYHVSLNFAPEDKINKERLLEITNDYMKGMGFDNNLHAIWQYHDASHLHVHLLCSRIKFDGSVVSDSNNYKRSEVICRQLEIKYGLQKLKPSIESKIRSPTKDELEMVARTGKPSMKMELQERVKIALSKSSSIDDFIYQASKQNFGLIFNQAKNGKVSGITYVMDGFIAKGQALGNAFKWNNIIQNLSYEQSRDSKAISQGNDSTRIRFGNEIQARSSYESIGNHEKSGGIVQMSKINEAKSGLHSKSERNNAKENCGSNDRAGEVIFNDKETSKSNENLVASLIPITNFSYNKNGLNTKLNGKKKNRPSL